MYGRVSQISPNFTVLLIPIPLANISRHVILYSRILGQQLRSAERSNEISPLSPPSDLRSVQAPSHEGDNRRKASPT